MISADPSLRGAVQHTRELARVLAIPRRLWLDADAADMAAQLTAALRTDGGTMTLRPLQAVALAECGMLGGLLGPIRVGGGKTLLSLLAPYVMNSQRPILLIPAKLVAKTVRAMRELAVHWRIPNFIRIVSYELLGRVQAADTLTLYRPDLIVADESHKLKNAKAAVTRRVMRYLDEHPCKLVAISGTVTKRSLKEYAHLLRHALPADPPIPRGYAEMESWAEALDELPGRDNGTDVGALLQLASAADLAAGDYRLAARRGFRRRLVETAGVVATTEGHVGCSLSIDPIDVPMDQTTDSAFAGLRDLWELPDGQTFVEALDMWRHARELALGFYYRWQPAAPESWMAARKAWHKACRYILTHNRSNLDSESQVVRFLDSVAAMTRAHRSTGEHYSVAIDALVTWRDIKETFVPNTVPVWLDDAAIRAAAKWMAHGPGIVWTEHRAFADRLAALTGAPYYGRQGKDAKGQAIPEFGEPGSGHGTIIASTASNAEGRNLQAWSRNLITSVPPNGAIWEQLLGRTHRDGQEADEVTYDCLVTCAEHVGGFWQARADAGYIEASTGQAQKILYADCSIPTADELASRVGPRWRR